MFRRRSAQTDDRTSRCSTPRKIVGCLGSMLVFLAATIILAVTVWWWNNRPPHIQIPTHGVPSPNGYTGFVQAGRLAKAIKHKAPASVATPEQQKVAESLSNLKALVRELAPAHAILRSALH